jgi:hypothetical protein
MRVVIEVNGGMVQDVTLEARSGELFAVPEILVKDRDVEGVDEDKVSVDAHGRHLQGIVPVTVDITD